MAKLQDHQYKRFYNLETTTFVFPNFQKSEQSSMLFENLIFKYEKIFGIENHLIIISGSDLWNHSPYFYRTSNRSFLKKYMVKIERIRFLRARFESIFLLPCPKTYELDIAFCKNWRAPQLDVSAPCIQINDIESPSLCLEYTLAIPHRVTQRFVLP